MVDSSQDNAVGSTIVDFNAERQLRRNRDKFANTPVNTDRASDSPNEEIIKNGVRLNQAFMQLKDPKDMEDAIAYVESLARKPSA